MAIIVGEPYSADVIAQLYAVALAARRLESACYAITLTNNPAPKLADVLNDEAAALLDVISGVLPGKRASIYDEDFVSVYFGTNVPAPGLAVAKVVDSKLVTVDFDGTIGTAKHAQTFTKKIPVKIGTGQAVDYFLTPTVDQGAITALALS